LSTKSSVVESHNSLTFSNDSSLSNGFTLRIPLSLMVSIVLDERIGIGLLIIGKIIFLPICFLYLLSFA
jgi:hypothetical protein